MLLVVECGAVHLGNEDVSMGQKTSSTAAQLVRWRTTPSQGTESEKTVTSNARAVVANAFRQRKHRSKRFSQEHEGPSGARVR